MSRIDAVYAAYKRSLAWEGRCDTLTLTRDLIEAGVTPLDEARVETIIVRTLEELASDYDGAYSMEDAAAEIAFKLGLASSREAADYNGGR